MKFKIRACFDNRDAADDYLYMVQIKEQKLAKVQSRKNEFTGKTEWAVYVCPRDVNFVMELL